MGEASGRWNSQFWRANFRCLVAIRSWLNVNQNGQLTLENIISNTESKQYGRFELILSFPAHDEADFDFLDQF